MIIENDIKLEINTSNFSKGFDFPNPHTDIIRRYKELGGLYVTVGSDAHKAQFVGSGFDLVEKIVEKPKVQESVKKEEVVKKFNKTVSKESKENIPKGAVNIKKTKIESIEKTTKKREDLPKVKIHEVERKVEKPKENIEIKEEKINSNIKNEQPKKEKSSGFKEIEMLGN